MSKFLIMDPTIPKLSSIAADVHARKWIASMDPQPPRFTIHQTIAEGDSVVTRGDMLMQEESNGPSVAYTFCDIYRFAGDKVAELTAFVIRTDKARAGDEARQMASARLD